MKINKTIWKCDACGAERECIDKLTGWMQLEAPLGPVHLCGICAREYVSPQPELGDNRETFLSRLLRRQTILIAIAKASTPESSLTSQAVISK